METILLAIGLVLIVEGLVYALAPSLIEDLLAALKNLSLDQRRMIGVLCLVIGLFFVWTAKYFGA
ncbi:DUF2065 domain-containing protein [Parasulfitobacter algicola]|uniref:DUF2065 domain-containing protein n=1 Tax=Parasulfitobacter algicola TaxID=2614809 RepID=A0ABX2IQ93_9RHOB|nr:DUF2065 domain-containing protein [Sulfitobacter algicola]NSX55039.1 DUF2065 domain-containing protein [Sulfitobacter algicola]